MHPRDEQDYARAALLELLSSDPDLSPAALGAALAEPEQPLPQQQPAPPVQAGASAPGLQLQPGELAQLRQMLVAFKMGLGQALTSPLAPAATAPVPSGNASPGSSAPSTAGE